MTSRLTGGGAPRPDGPPNKDKAQAKGTTGGSLSNALGLGKSYDKAVNPGNPNLGLSGPAYSGPHGPGTGVDAGNPGNKQGKLTEGGNATKSAPQKNLPTGVTPLSQPKPMGATPYVEGADLFGIGARALLGIGGAITSGLTQGITGEDPTQSMLGEHLGKQVGWSADPSMTPGRDRAQRGSKRESFDQTTLGSATGTAGDDSKTAAPAPTDKYSDIQMKDRRKPGLKQMLETML